MHAPLCSPARVPANTTDRPLVTYGSVAGIFVVLIEECHALLLLGYRLPAAYFCCQPLLQNALPSDGTTASDQLTGPPNWCVTL
jgi:hypothetical protein